MTTTVKLRDSRTILHTAGATIAVAFLTLLLVLVRLNEAATGLAFLTIVVWFAARAGLGLSLYVALLCAVSFDYFFLPPVHTFRLAGVHQWIEMLSFAICSVVVGRLAERARRQSRRADQRREDVERLYSLSQDMMIHEDAVRLASDLPNLIQRRFALEAVILYVRDSDEFYASIPDIPPEIRATMLALSEVNPVVPTSPAEYSFLALMLGLKSIGAMAWRPASLSRELAAAIGAQLAIALTRALAIETYTRIEAAREGDRLRTALIDSLTHELRTPLTAIRAAATTLVQGEGLNEEIRQDLAALVDEESERLDKLIGEAVEMAEIDANVVQVHCSQQPPRQLLEQAVEASHSLLAAHKVNIDVENSEDPAWFDPHLLGRVLRHLLENAARYSPPGSIITLRSARRSDRLEFSVEDNGPGIDSNDLPLIFKKFYRGKKGATIGKGTGMGLAIASAILAVHGGGINVSSTPGHGANFRFWVPLAEREAADVR